MTLTHPGQLRAAGRLRSLGSVQISHSVRGLGFLGELPPLEELIVHDLREGADLTVLRHHPGLKRLMVYGDGQVRGASVLGEPTELCSLALPLHGDLALDALRPLSGLRFISLSRVGAETDLSPLTALPGLDTLHLVLSAGREAPGFDELAGMTRLTTLYLDYYDVNAWLASLGSAPPALAVLSLHCCAVPPEQHAFARFERLTHLSLSDCRAPDGAPITGLDLPGVHTMVG